MDDKVRAMIDVINHKIKELNSLYHMAANKSDISDGEVDIWSALLNTEEELSQQDLCERLFLSKQTINSLVSGMVKKGFVFLEHSPGSRNRKIIHLTEDGKKYGNEKVRWIFEAEQRAMEDTDPVEVQAYISMLEKYRGYGWRSFYLIYGMCDESFSINYSAAVPENVDRGWFMFFVTLLNHFYWFSGSTLGGIFGSLIHFDTEGLDFVMTAMFVVIFLEQWLKEKNHASSLLGLALSLICLIAFGADNFIIPAMLAILILLTMIRRPLEARISSSTDITKETEKGGGQP